MVSMGASWGSMGTMGLSGDDDDVDVDDDGENHNKETIKGNHNGKTITGKP